MKTAKIYLMYERLGKIAWKVEAEEMVEASDADTLKKTLCKILDLMRDPYVYDSRIEFPDGSYYAICSDTMSLLDKKYSIRHSDAWNSHDEWERKTRSEVKNTIMAAYEKQIDYGTKND